MLQICVFPFRDSKQRAAQAFVAFRSAWLISVRTNFCLPLANSSANEEGQTRKTSEEIDRFKEEKEAIAPICHFLVIFCFVLYYFVTYAVIWETDGNREVWVLYFGGSKNATKVREQKRQSQKKQNTHTYFSQMFQTCLAFYVSGVVMSCQGNASLNVLFWLQPTLGALMNLFLEPPKS